MEKGKFTDLMLKYWAECHIDFSTMLAKASRHREDQVSDSLCIAASRCLSLPLAASHCLSLPLTTSRCLSLPLAASHCTLSRSVWLHVSACLCTLSRSLSLHTDSLPLAAGCLGEETHRTRPRHKEDRFRHNSGGKSSSILPNDFQHHGC